MRLINDARLHKFDVVWVNSLTRLDLRRRPAPIRGRTGPFECAFIAQLENTDTDQSDWSTKLGMWSMLAQWESDRLKFAFEVKASRGEYKGSLAPYGYNLTGKKLVRVYDGSTEVIQQIFKWYLDGTGPGSIREKDYITSKQTN